MPSAAREGGLLVLAALVLSGCGQKGPLCLQEPRPATVPVTAPAAAADSSAPAATATAAAPATAPSASTATPHRPVVPGYTRCR
jgi:predicted small lipoprotein YifL